MAVATRQRTRMARYRYYCRTVATFLFSHIGLCAMVVAYSTGGAALFQFLEKDYEMLIRDEVDAKRDQYTEQLWNVTYNQEILKKENWSEHASDVLHQFEEYLINVSKMHGFDGKDKADESRWTFMGALLYSIIVITTIGYGDRVPLTFPGKIVTIFYAIAGIPLMLLFLSNIGDVMANSFKFTYWKLCAKSKMKKKRKEKRRRRRRKAHRRRTVRRANNDAVFGEEIAMTPITAAIDATRYTDHHDASQVPIISNKYAMQTDTMDAINHSHFVFPQRIQSDTNYGDVSRALRTRNEQQQMTECDESADESEEEEEEDNSYKEVNVPISMCLSLVVGYICIGGKLFKDLEGWEYFEGFYFCFVTLTTIGFGDYVPGQKLIYSETTIAQVVSAIYLIFGMALLAMSLNLIRDAVANKVKDIGKKIGIVADKDSDSM